jgi:hypothetical protein
MKKKFGVVEELITDLGNDHYLLSIKYNFKEEILLIIKCMM